MISADSGNTWSKCYSFILPQSHKTPLGSWDISLESQHAPIDFDEVFGQKIAEDLQVKTHQSESTGTVDGNLISKIQARLDIFCDPVKKKTNTVDFFHTVGQQARKNPLFLAGFILLWTVLDYDLAERGGFEPP